MTTTTDFYAQNLGGNIYQYSGSVDTSAVQITFASPANQIIIQSSHSTQNILVSFNGGVQFFTVWAKTHLDLSNVCVRDIYIKGSGSATTYEILISY